MSTTDIAPAYTELLELVDRDGYVTPTSVLDAASDESSAMHSHFEWDDTAAAHSYRLVQARRLITRYKVTVIESPDQTVRVRAFSAVGNSRYQPTETAMGDPVSRDVVMQQAMRELAALRRKYQGLVDFDAVLSAAMREVA